MSVAPAGDLLQQESPAYTTALHCRYWLVWVKYTRQCAAEVAMAVSLHQKALERRILRQWSGHSRHLASERKAKV